MMNLVTESTQKNREISPGTGIGEESVLPSQSPAWRASETPISRSTDLQGMCTLGTVRETQPLSTPLSMAPTLSVTNLSREDDLHPRLKRAFGRHFSPIVNQAKLSSLGSLPKGPIDTTKDMR